MSATRPPLEDGVLEQTLRDYQESPGRYSIARREPGVLYEHAHAVLLVAAGRYKWAQRAHAPDPADFHHLQQAARFFVRQVFLRQGADHYTLLGVDAGADASTIREHYRLLIRLTHPDFASAADAWPPDTAARVNLAYDALSTPDKRGQYDEQLQQPPRKTPERAPRASTVASTHLGAARPKATKGSRQPLQEDRDGLRTRKLYVFGGLAGFAAVTLLVLLWASTPPEDHSLQATSAPATAMATARMPTTVLAQTRPDPTIFLQPPSTEQVLPEVPEVPGVPDVPEIPKAALAASATTRWQTREKKPTAAPLPTPAAIAALAAQDTAEDATAGPMTLGLTLALNLPAAAEAWPPEHGNATALALARPKPPQPDQVPASVEAASTSPAGKPVADPLDMRALQPLLAGLVEAMQSGSGAQVQQWIERVAPQSPSASAFAASYHAALGGGRVVGLGQVKFTPRATTSPQQVDGAIQLNLQYADQPATVRSFRLRAYFDQHTSGPKLSHLEAR